MTKAIELENVTFSYGNTKPQLNDVSLSVDIGECVLITGNSGCGKTTLTRLLNGLIPHYYEGTCTGKIQIMGQDATTFAMWEYGESVGSVFQDARSQFFTSHVLDELAFVSENYAVNSEIIKNNLNTVVKNNQLSYLVHRKLEQLSSGEKQKVAMAAVQVHQPDIYVLDEPSANLENDACVMLATNLAELKAAGKTIIVADHRIAYLIGVLDRIIYMDEGQITKTWTKNEFLAIPEETYQQLGLRCAQPVIVPVQCATAYGTSTTTPKTPPYLVVDDLTVAYNKKEKALLSHVNLQMNQGEILVLTGANGLGKTTLARTLCGLLKEQAGRILIAGKALTYKQRQQHFWFVLQDTDYQLFSDSVRSELLLGLPKTDENKQKATSLLEDLGLAALSEQHPATLSGGQKQRLTFAVGLMRNPQILILDEPTSGLDAENMLRMQKLIQTYAKKGLSFIIISHDLEFAEHLTPTVVQISASKVE